jgi:PKHD-type hydroxylase
MRYHWYVHENFFSKKEIKKINKTIILNKDKDWKDGPSLSSSKKCEVNISQYNSCKSVLNKAVEYLYYINNTMFGFDINKVTDYNRIFLNIYDSKDNGHYDFHYDGEPSEKPYTSKLTLLINTSEEKYEGGEFMIFSAKETEITNFSKPGDILIFPSIFFHAVKPVTKGKRKSVAMWGFGPHWR